MRARRLALAAAWAACSVVDGLAAVPPGSRTLQIALGTRRIVCFFVLRTFIAVSSFSKVTVRWLELAAHTADVRRTSHVISRLPMRKLCEMLCPLSRSSAVRVYKGMAWRAVYGSSVCRRRSLRWAPVLFDLLRERRITLVHTYECAVGTFQST